MATSKAKSPSNRLVMVYATGSDTELRFMCCTLLEEGLVTKADLVDRAPFELDDEGIAKLRWSGRAVTLVCRRSKLKSVLRRMKQLYQDDDLQAFAIPVLATIG